MNLTSLQKIIGYTFQNQELLKNAFVHRSYLNENRTIRQSNERLEFLGDAVLSFLTSEYLYLTYKNYPEGILTNVRSGLVRTKSLSDIAGKLDLGSLLLLSRGEEDSGGRSNTSLLADCFEALLGALYLDAGIEMSRKFLASHLFPIAQHLIDQKSYIDYKSYLQEIIQEQSKVSPGYRVVRDEGPDHAKTFWVEVVAGNNILGKGQGKSKQEAEQGAASDALAKMGRLPTE